MKIEKTPVGGKKRLKSRLFDDEQDTAPEEGQIIARTLGWRRDQFEQLRRQRRVRLQIGAERGDFFRPRDRRQRMGLIMGERAREAGRPKRNAVAIPADRAGPRAEFRQQIPRQRARGSARPPPLEPQGRERLRLFRPKADFVAGRDRPRADPDAMAFRESLERAAGSGENHRASLSRERGAGKAMRATEQNAMAPRVKKCIALFAGRVAVAGAARPAASFEGLAFGRNGLWGVVHGVCSPMSRLTGLPAPCLAVDHARGFATLRAPDEATHIIVTPLVRVSGIESPALLRKDAPNYWADAWSERHWVEEGAGRPLAWSDIGMAINSRAGRSQDQLHIHVDCVKPEIKTDLARAARGRKGWFEINLRPTAGRYHGRALSAGELDRNIFRMVALEIPRARDNMAGETIAVIGLDEPPAGRGFLLLAAGGGGHAEELLDHQCRIGRNVPSE